MFCSNHIRLRRRKSAGTRAAYQKSGRVQHHNVASMVVTNGNEENQNNLHAGRIYQMG